MVLSHLWVVDAKGFWNSESNYGPLESTSPVQVIENTQKDTFSLLKVTGLLGGKG